MFERAPSWMKAGQIDWVNVALDQNPNNPFPHRCLAQLYSRAKQDQVKATEHRKRAEALGRD